MNEDEVAKYLLLEGTCNTCTHNSHGRVCSNNEGPYSYYDLPEELTCDYWAQPPEMKKSVIDFLRSWKD